MVDDTLKSYGHFIDGRWLSPAGGASLPGYNPATAEPWYEFARGSADDADRAVKAARSALDDPAWSGITQTRRAALLRRLGLLVEQHADELARVESRDNGKRLSEVRAQMRGLADYYHYYAGLADKIEGRVIPGYMPNIFNYTLREPLGVIAAIAPWNSPLQLATLKVAPALATANTVVIKPSEHASASILEFVSLVEEAGFPPGVVNVVTGLGTEVGAALVRHPLVAKVAFTGGTDSGRVIGEMAGANLTRVTLELGGKSPQIVLPDADLESAVRGIVSGVFLSSGQTCIAGSRVFLHVEIADKVCNRLVERAAMIRIGDPQNDRTEMGPLATKQQVERMQYYVRIGRDEGATLVHGGKQPDNMGNGWYFEPTIFADATNEMRIAQEEIFGPIVALIPFESESDAIRLANQTPYGLAAGVWTRDLATAHRMVRAIDAGTVYVNNYRSMAPMSPLAGFKASGVGQENGISMIYEYTREKSVWLNMSADTLPDPLGG